MGQPKQAYRVRNWSEYNQSLVNRGSLSFWFADDVIAAWQLEPEGKIGRPQLYSDTAILCALSIQSA